jgi:hypothetical protein
MVIASNQGFTAGIPYKTVFAGKAQMSEVQRLYCAYITNMDGYAQVYYVYIPVVAQSASPLPRNFAKPCEPLSASGGQRSAIGKQKDRALRTTIANFLKINDKK